MLTKSRIFSITFDSSSLNIFSSLPPHLLQIIERINVFWEIFDILGFFNYLYIPQTMQWIFFILTSLEFTENISVLFCHSFCNCLEKINWHTLTNFYLSTQSQ